MARTSSPRSPAGPPQDAGPVPLDLVIARAQQAFDACVEEFRGELPDLIRRLLAIDTGGGDYAAASLRELMRRANDIRGAAQVLGSEATAEIADTIFKFAEAIPPDGRLARPLVVLLAQSSLRLVDDRLASRRDEFQRDVQAILTEMHGRMASQAVDRT